MGRKRDRRPAAGRAADEAQQGDFGWGLMFDGGAAHKHAAAGDELPALVSACADAEAATRAMREGRPGRCVWVQDADVQQPLRVGELVTAAAPLADWCLRGDDGSEPIPAGSALEVVELRPWGGAMVRELSAERTAQVEAVQSYMDRLTP